MKDPQYILVKFGEKEIRIPLGNVNSDVFQLTLSKELLEDFVGVMNTLVKDDVKLSITSESEQRLKENHKRIDQVIDSLVDSINDYNIPNDWAFYGSSYYREFRTVGLQVPRQYGKSEWLIDRHMHKRYESLLFVKNHNMFSYIQSKFGASLFNKNVYYPAFFKTWFIGKDYSHIKYIYIDDLDGKELNDFYEILPFMKIPKDVVIIRLFS